MAHTGVDFDGVLRVTDPALFTQSLAAGIGAGKAWGFGLLSVARVQ
jgi:CRISPR system Cascade subunit CasE